MKSRFALAVMRIMIALGIVGQFLAIARLTRGAFLFLGARDGWLGSGSYF